MLLAGDIGGTNARLAVFDHGTLARNRTYPVAGYRGIHEILTEFLEKEKIAPAHASFAVAGIIRGNVATGTNLPWIIDGNALREQFGFKNVLVMNDFEAAAWGVTGLSPKDIVQLGGATAIPGMPMAVLGAGTGLGEATIVPCPERSSFHIIPSEGGHADFAPRNMGDIGLFQYLAKKYGHVSMERVLSGRGLEDLYAYLVRQEGGTVEGRMTAPEISRAAMRGDNHPAQRALELFCGYYGAEAGNLALKTLARGGVYIAGGIAPSILPFIVKSSFRAAFEDKGRMSGIVAAIPVFIVTCPHLGLLGAALAEHHNPT